MKGVRDLLARGPGRARGASSAVVLMAALALLLGAHPVLAQKPRAERPTYAVGEQWLLKDGVYELMKVEKDRYIFAANTDRGSRLMTATHKCPMPTVSFDLTTSAVPRRSEVGHSRLVLRAPV